MADIKNEIKAAVEAVERELTEKEIGEQRQIKRKKLEELRAMGRDPYREETFDVTAWSKDIKDNFDAMEDQEGRVAGRIMACRRMGKVAFVDMQDKQGRIQIFVARDNIGQDEYNIFKTYDTGDILGIKGEVFRTKTGEVSVRAQEVKLLCKSLQVLPNKWHGLKDTDLRYRQRYVDLIMNEDVRETFMKRAKIISTMRKVLEEDYDLIRQHRGRCCSKAVHDSSQHARYRHDAPHFARASPQETHRRRTRRSLRDRQGVQKRGNGQEPQP